MDIKENIVITGVSGRFPDCNNVEEFKNALLNGVDLITGDDGRFQSGTLGTPKRIGKIPQPDKFDAAFFGILPAQANFIDPRQRILLEAIYECIVDAGYNPRELSGSKTGVYVAISSFPNVETMMEQNTNGYGGIGTILTMAANRASYFFNFKGPSYAVDCACAGSMVVFNNAIKDMQTGVTNSAIVCGTHLILNPFETLEHMKAHVLSEEGKCKTFNMERNGFARAESVVSIFLQREGQSRRIYATVLDTATNSTGYQKEGIAYPSSEMQSELLKNIYCGTGVNPNDVAYVEVHGTGTPAGDKGECQSLVNTFFGKRRDPLLIGSIKSNMGHSEQVSGLCSITKVLIAMEGGVIPANLHAEPLDMKLPGIQNGTLKVVTENRPWNGGIVGISGLGLGGINTHIVLKSNPKEKANTHKRTNPRLVHVSGRTEKAVNYFLDEIEKNKDDDEFLALIDEVHKINVEGHDYRGYIMLGDNSRREVEKYIKKRPIWFIYTGMGSQWIEMGRDLLKIDVFRNTIRRCASALKPYNIDLLDVLTNPSVNTFDDITHCICAIAAVEIALTDILHLLGIVPEGFAGHSAGEVGCAYANGHITPEEAVLLAYARGLATNNIRPTGQMAAIGLSIEECQKILPEDVFIACENSNENITISGPKESVNNLVIKLRSQGIFARNVNSGGFAYHTKYVKDGGPAVFNFVKNVLKTPELRSKKWISTSIPDHMNDESWTQYNSAEYHANNFCNKVLFNQVYQHIPEDAIVIEVGPHGLLQGILKRQLGPNTTNISLINRNSDDNEVFFLCSIGKIYLAGGIPNLRNFYRNVTFPVSRGTSMLSSMIKWDHHESWFTPYWKKKDYFGEPITVNLNDKNYTFLEGHNINGKVLIPAAFYMELVWKVFSYMETKDRRYCPVVINDVKFNGLTVLSPNEDVKFLINITKKSGYFEILEGESVVVTGRISSPTDINNEYCNLEQPKLPKDNYLLLNQEDFYKIYRLRRCAYKGVFKSVKQCDVYGSRGIIEWKGNFTGFINNMNQITLPKARMKEIVFPLSIEKLVLNPNHLVHAPKGRAVEVFHNHELNITKSEGIEITGLQLSKMPQPQTQEDTVLERFEFVPYVSSEKKSLDEALYTALQIIFQNCGSFIIRLKIYEIPENDAALANHVRKTLNRQVIADPIYIQNDQDQENNQCDVIIAADVAFDQSIVENTLKCMKAEGFVLFIGKLSKIPNCNLQVVYKACCDQSSVCLLRQNYKISDSYTAVNISNSNLEWLEVIKNIIKCKEPTVAYLYSQDDPASGIMGLTKCLLTELTETTFISTMIMDKDAQEFSVDDEFYRGQLVKSLCINVLQNGQWGTYVHQPLKCLEKREVNDACIAVTTLKDLSSLSWIERPTTYTSLDPESQLIYVFYSTVNRRDVSVVLGNLSLPESVEYANKEICVGTEYAGVTKTGERVMGLTSSGGLSLKVQGIPVFSWQVPRSWSLEDAATVPYAYVLCYYAMITRGHMQTGESILIHAGSGGIRQAAISIALGMRCTVFTTVTSQEEHDHIKKLYPTIIIERIGNLRSTSFRKLIQSVTKGQGVDVILNSLAANSFQESSQCISSRARFLEIGGVESLDDTAIYSRIFDRGCNFHRVGLDDILKESLEDQQKIKYLLEEGIRNGIVQPLHRKIFEETEVSTAFMYLNSGKHEEKILIRIREEDPITIHSPTRSISAIPKLYFEPSKSYIVIGGLGGLGLELTDWLIKKGATKVILNSRRHISTGYQSYCFNNWSQFRGITVEVNTEDTTTLEGAKNLIAAAKALGPVGGIFHLALILQDASIENQTKEMYETVFKSKIVSTQNLDVVTRSNCPELDHFVVFSSTSSGKGNFNTSNYGMANSAVEMLCVIRKQENLPALAVQWGPVADVGMYARMKDNVANVDKALQHILPQNVDFCWNILENFILQSATIVACTVLSNKNSKSVLESAENPSNTVANIMQLKNLDTVDKDASLSRLGMDSIMFAEVRRALYTKFQLKFSAQDTENLTFNKLIGMGTKTQDASVVTS